MKNPLAWFVVLAYAISWSIFGVAQWLIRIQGPLAWTMASALFMFGPALAALIVRKQLGQPWRGWVAIRPAIRWKWMVIALGLALSIPVLTLVVDMIGGNVLHVDGFGHAAITKDMFLQVVGQRLEDAKLPPATIAAQTSRLAGLPLGGPALIALMLLAGALAGCTVNLVFALGEELGWRGLLFDLTRHWGISKQVLFTGVAWGLWHAPLILHGLNYPGHPQLGVAFMCVFTTALAWPMAWVRRRSGTVLAPAVLHGTVNATAGIVLVFNNGAHELVGGPAGAAPILAILLLGLLLCIFDPGLPRAFRQG